MNTYICLTKFVDEGKIGMAQAPGSMTGIAKAQQELGIKWRTNYLTLGQYDMVLVFDAPDSNSAAVFAVTCARTWGLRTETLLAFAQSNENEGTAAIIEKLS